jgi:hypothetical protein
MEKNLLQQGDIFRMDLGTVDTNIKALTGLTDDFISKTKGEYFVEKAGYEEECSVPEFSGVFHGHHVYCVKKDDPNIKLDFFQTGNFPVLFTHVKPINMEIEPQ